LGMELIRGYFSKNDVTISLLLGFSIMRTVKLGFSGCQGRREKR
jgi:hypothetical protein